MTTTETACQWCGIRTATTLSIGFGGEDVCDYCAALEALSDEEES